MGVRSRSTGPDSLGPSSLPRLATATSGGATGPISAQLGVSRCGRHLFFRISRIAARARGLGSSLAHCTKPSRGS
ncbi:hypothetical protein NDU88_009326 [Pleurodeles waltl]|uniref:Uncharacterized protein n=1 Tax=Pleurodeles waltl TaxID=8319 RepID=A0AAV7RXA8_PLEWA|nr:hypothetical protein NDU88_009326 [Pleurodeles waltl]